MRIAYIITWNLSHNDGVTRKVLRQVQEWKDLGHEVQVFCATEKKGENIPGVHFFIKDHVWSSPLAAIRNRKVYSSLCDAVVNYQPDLVYLRWEFHKKSLNKLMNLIPTVIEINTLFKGEFKRRSRENWIEFIRYWYYLMTHNKFNKSSSGFVSASKEILELGGYYETKKPCSFIPNSIPISENQETVSYSKPQSGIPRLVFISSGIQPWHGMQNLIELAKNSIGELEFDLITGFDAESLELPENIQIYSFLEKEDFMKVFKGAVAGIGSAGLYENGMDEASVLKVREYLAAGLPVIVPYKDTAFLDKELPEWFLELPNEAGALAREKENIINFVKKMEGFRIPLYDVIPYVGSKYWEAERVKFMEDVLNNS